GHWPTSSNLERLEGYKRALEEAGIEVRDEYIYCGEFRMENGYREGIKILRAGKYRPTAVFSANDAMAIGLLEACNEEGVRVPEELSIIGFDDIPLSASRLIQLTTVSQSTAELGSLSGKIIMDKVLNPRKKDVRQQIVFPPKLVIRGTCARIKEE
ncbi:MAG TPA: substrate-binding domain-containing protein, partial [Candidatus Atribacteria bacterium]|nr:substrate-binding domain-containing protein [Candidatus Atribacteria bacterium]